MNSKNLPPFLVYHESIMGTGVDRCDTLSKAEALHQNYKRVGVAISAIYTRSGS